MTEEDVEPAEAQHETGKQRPEIRWGVVASVVAHIPIVALLIFGLPKIEPKPVEDESVKVELVPPPEEKKPEPEEKPPEPKPPEEAKKEPPPPPPPPPPPSPPPPPPPPPPEAAKPQAEPPRSSRTFRPVLEFADKGSAPKETEQGEPQQAEAPKPPIADVKPEEAPVEPPQPEKPQVSETMPAANPLPQDIELPQVETVESNPEKNGPTSTGQDEAKTNFEQPRPTEDTTVQAPSTPPKAEAKEADKMIKAKTLFSEKAVASPMIKTAISNLPRGERINQLCQTELRQQLIHSASQYQPRWLPSYSRLSGSVLDARRGAFKSRNEWFEVRFRCEVDNDAMKIISFEYDVGKSVPRSEWKSRRFPED